MRSYKCLTSSPFPCTVGLLPTPHFLLPYNSTFASLNSSHALLSQSRWLPRIGSHFKSFCQEHVLHTCLLGSFPLPSCLCSNNLFQWGLPYAPPLKLTSPPSIHPHHLVLIFLCCTYHLLASYGICLLYLLYLLPVESTTFLKLRNYFYFVILSILKKTRMVCKYLLMNEWIQGWFCKPLIFVTLVLLVPTNKPYFKILGCSYCFLSYYLPHKYILLFLCYCACLSLFKTICNQLKCSTSN